MQALHMQALHMQAIGRLSDGGCFGLTARRVLRVGQAPVARVRTDITSRNRRMPAQRTNRHRPKQRVGDKRR